MPKILAKILDAHQSEDDYFYELHPCFSFHLLLSPVIKLCHKTVKSLTTAGLLSR